MYLFKRKFPFEMFIQHDNSLGFLDKHICKPISSIQSIKDVKVLFYLPSSWGILLISLIAHMR
jgi:hypothetical protein